MDSNFGRLHLDMPDPKANKIFTKGLKPDDVVDSWEDDDLSSPSDYGSQTPIEAPGPSLKPITSLEQVPNPPPPTPKAENGYVDWGPANAFGGGRPLPYSVTSPSGPRTDANRDRRRPEKTTATANRMIAASLGLKAPKKTEEQRQYERAMKEQEIKRRNREREEKEREQEADNKAKGAMWDT